VPRDTPPGAWTDARAEKHAACAALNQRSWERELKTAARRAFGHSLARSLQQAAGETQINKEYRAGKAAKGID
jgi:hypothetical protein